MFKGGVVRARETGLGKAELILGPCPMRRLAEAYATLESITNHEVALDCPPSVLRADLNALAGRAHDARAVWDALEAPAAKRAYAFIAMVYCALEEYETALDRLERSGHQSFDHFVYLRFLPEFRPLDDHPRMLQILRQANLET